MYKVISISLTVLFGIALILSMTGALAFSPLAMIASVAVLGVTVWLTSMLFGLMFGVRVHAESSFITAMILFFIFSPTLTVLGLLALALTGAVAGASKFILVYKGRHIFNPAALAAFVIGILGISSVSWWVGTPVLIIPTLLLGLFILQKTRRMSMGVTFIGIATILVFFVMLSIGQSIGQSLTLLLSWPIIFFAAYMLTEPLTLPGRKWQQLVEAAVVAIIFAVPFHIGEFATSLAFALIAGNLIAFGFARHQKITLTFIERRKLTPTSYEFIFRPYRNYSYQPGQYVEITVPHKKSDFRGNRRSFSLTSAPGEETMRLGIKFYEPSSTFKKALQTLQPGTVIQSTGISGDFMMPKDSQVPVLYVAGGIGITPFISHLQDLMRRHETRDIVLVYSIRSIAECAYRDILEASGITVVIVTKSDTPLALPSHWIHINELFMSQDAFMQHIPDITRRIAFISGPPRMIDGVKGQLKKLHVRNIKTDYFTGY